MPVIVLVWVFKLYRGRTPLTLGRENILNYKLVDTFIADHEFAIKFQKSQFGWSLKENIPRTTTEM